MMFVMAIKPNFLTSMGYHIFLTMVLHARSSANKELNFIPIKADGDVNRTSVL